MLLIFLSQISTKDGIQVQKEGPCGTPSQLLTEVKITLKPWSNVSNVQTQHFLALL